MEVISRKDAKEQGLKVYYTGKPCKNGHFSERYASSTTCVDCSKAWAKSHKNERAEYMKEYQERTSYKEYQKKYRTENKEVLSKAKLEWRQFNKEKVKEYFREYNEKNYTKLREYRKEYYSSEEVRLRYKEKYKENPLAFTVHNACREALKRTTQCRWADKKILRQIFKKIKLLNKESKTTYHADHILPLKHPLVCGLHNHFNLRIVTASENLTKSNKFDPDRYRHEDYTSFWDEINLA
jgi:hypothetical protein